MHQDSVRKTEEYTNLNYEASSSTNKLSSPEFSQKEFDLFLKNEAQLEEYIKGTFLDKKSESNENFQRDHSFPQRFNI